MRERARDGRVGRIKGQPDLAPPPPIFRLLKELSEQQPS